MSLPDLSIVAIGVLDFALSLAVILRNKKSQTHISFALFSFFLGAWAFGIAFFRMSVDPLFAFFWAKDIYISGSCIASSLFYFALVFPNGRVLTHRMKAFILVPLLLQVGLLLIPSYLTRSVRFHSWGKDVLLGKPEYLLFSIFFVGFFWGAIVLLWKQYQKSAGRTKKQMKFLVVSILVAGFISSIFDLILPWFGNYQLIFIGPISSGLIFWLVSYAIVRHKLWDFKFVIVRSLAYTLLVVWIASLYTAGVFWISRFFLQKQVTDGQAVIYAVLAIFVAFTFEPLKKFLEKVTDNIFFKNRYHTHALLSELTQAMATTLALNELTRKTLKILIETIHISRGGFYILQGDGWYPPVVEGIELTTDELVKLKQLAEQKRLLFLEEEQNEGLKQIMREMNVVLIIPLLSSHIPQGVLFLGEKKSGEAYSEQDLEVFQIFGPEVSVAIENAKAVEEIKNFNSTLREKVDEATDQLRSANDQLKEVDKLKDEFVSLASHELRTPMTAIKSYLWMAIAGKGGKLTEKQQYYLDRAYRSTDRLITLVNDMLNISRIESGRVLLDLSEVDIVKLAQEVAEEVLPHAQQLGIYVNVEENSATPHVLADPDKIKEVLINLIGNSLKFTQRGGVIEVSFAVHNFVHVTVRDSGVGIAASDLSKLFQKFGFIPGSYVINRTVTQGSGLGLYLCRSIIKMHGGEIGAASEGIGKGTTFTFSLQKFDQHALDEYRHLNPQPEHSVELVHTRL
jgi:signal transduction histidine kinase